MSDKQSVLINVMSGKLFMVCVACKKTIGILLFPLKTTNIYFAYIFRAEISMMYEKCALWYWRPIHLDYVLSVVAYLPLYKSIQVIIDKENMSWKLIYCYKPSFFKISWLLSISVFFINVFLQMFYHYLYAFILLPIINRDRFLGIRRYS